MELKDKVAVVTGGSRGIGKAIALELGRAGATVIVNYNASRDAAESVVAALQNGGHAVQADVSTTDGCICLIEAAKTLGGIDILVNNAGINIPMRSLKDISIEDWRQVIDININFRSGLPCLSDLHIIFTISTPCNTTNGTSCRPPK